MAEQSQLRASTAGEIMSAHRNHRRPTGLKRGAAIATGVLAALAIAAPVAEAGTADLRAADAPAASTVVPADGSPGAVAVGPTIIDSVFNGPTTIVTTTP
jgi:hypothetical protein